MEEGLLKDIKSTELETPKVQVLLKALNAAVDEAKDIRNTYNFKNPVLRRALHIVEDFIKDKKRICYGGMAINAHLPLKMQFYDFTKNLPDYDFFTDEAEKDINDLIRRLNSENLPNIEAKLGLHEGTTKIYVDFNAVADITEVSTSFYKTLLGRSFLSKGIHYADANFLRMSMYLELSRPMGEVERWEKVFGRLYLFNKAVPLLKYKCKQIPLSKITSEQRRICLTYCSLNLLVYAAADLEPLYKNPSKTLSNIWLKKSNYPVIAFSRDPVHDTNILKKLLENADRNSKLRIYKWSPNDEFIPFLLGIVHNGKIIALIVKQTACHSYNTISYGGQYDNSVLDNRKENVLLVASLDTLISLYFSLSYIRGLEGLVKVPFNCMANKLVEISQATRDNLQSGTFPMFPLTCSGHQTTKESLLLAKKVRVQEWKKKHKTKKNTRI